MCSRKNARTSWCRWPTVLAAALAACAVVVGGITVARWMAAVPVAATQPPAREGDQTVAEPAPGSDEQVTAAVISETTPIAYLPLVVEMGSESFAFAVTADMRQFSGPGGYDTSQYFRGACEAIGASAETVFMVSPGDVDPPADVEWTIRQYLGETYVWFPVVGNHERETPADMAWLRERAIDPNGDAPPNVVSVGPPGCEETTYSFNHGNAHFVVLNEYCDGVSDTALDGDVADAVYEWLAADLGATDKTHVFVFGHEPAYPQPDASNGRIRHQYDSLNAHPVHRDRFWSLLSQYGVVAYICGHTHNYSAVEVDGVWQLDAGHARGLGDTGARSTFILVRVEGDVVSYETYRDDAAGGPYVLADVGVLD